MIPGKLDTARRAGRECPAFGRVQLPAQRARHPRGRPAIQAGAGSGGEDPQGAVVMVVKGTKYAIRRLAPEARDEIVRRYRNYLASGREATEDSPRSLADHYGVTVQMIHYVLRLGRDGQSDAH